MNNRSAILFPILLSLTFNACGESRKQKSVEAHTAFTPTELSATEKSYFDSFQRKTGVVYASDSERQAFASQLPEPNGDSEIDLTFTATPKPTDGPVILMIESNFYPITVATRYRRQIDGLYQWNKTQEAFENWTFNFRFNSDSEKLLQTIENRPSLFAAEDFFFLKQNKHYDFVAKGESPPLLHASIVAGILLEQNPKARLVIAPRPMLTTEEICRLESPSEQRKVIALFAKVAEELQTIIKNHNVTAVNLSHGLNTNYWDTLWSHCPDVLKRAEVQRAITAANLKILKALTDNPQLLVFEASDNTPRKPMTPQSSLYEYLCFSAPNLLRVAFMTEAQSFIPPEGIPFAKDRVYHTQKNALSCADVVINAGFDEAEDSFEAAPHILEYGPKPLFFTTSGFNVLPLNSMATSWATPHALSLALFIAQSARDLEQKILTPVQIKTLMKYRMFDPALNDQSEFLTGYRLSRGRSFMAKPATTL